MQSRPSQYTNLNMRVQISTLPVHGKLYQAQFNPGGEFTYATIATTLHQYGPMEEIVEGSSTHVMPNEELCNNNWIRFERDERIRPERKRE